MKTLDQVEPRTPVSAATTPGDDKSEFIIANAGSYYLTGDIQTTKQTAIHLAAGGITLDLNGFSIIKTGLQTGTGVLIASGKVTVRNGTIRGWQRGVDAMGTDVSGGVYEA
jgi:hypothetical protein